MLDNKVAIVTGASSGIGRAIAKKMIEAGATVIGVARSEDKLQSVKEWLGENFHYKVADVSEYERAQQVVREVYEEFGRIDILVNNAGITQDTLLARMDKEKWQKVIDVNLGGVFNYTKAALTYMMKQRSGVVINISSVVGLYGNAGQANYAASKAGIIGFTKSLAKEVGKRGIRAVAIAPGFIETPMTENIPENLKKLALESIPLGRFGQPDEVANVVVFLASDLASYITSTVIEVHGGLAF